MYKLRSALNGLKIYEAKTRLIVALDNLTHHLPRSHDAAFQKIKT